jgi:hypothetical protein
MPLSAIEPLRDVPAVEWKSPYCATWDDGCTECTRSAVWEEPSCRPVDHYIGGGRCMPRGNLCISAIENETYDELERVCWRIHLVSISRPGVLTGMPALNPSLSNFVYDPQRKRWRIGVLELASNPETEKQFAELVMKAIGRHPNTEFSLTSRDFVSTLYCASARTEKGGGVEESPIWLKRRGDPYELLGPK